MFHLLAQVVLLASAYDSRMIGSILIGHGSQAIDTSAGCFFSEEGDASSDFVFVESDGIWVNIDGKNVKLERAEDDPGTWPDVKHERSTLRYRGADVTVVLDVERTTQCEEGEECAGAGYRGSMTVTADGRRQLVKIVGGCGC
jgi:hypothetical protein